MSSANVAGNTVVAKPPERAPLTASLLAGTVYADVKNTVFAPEGWRHG